MTESTTMDAAGKQRVKAALLSQAKAALETLSGQVGHHRAASRFADGDSYTVDDLSQADEAHDLGGLFEQSLARQQAAVRAIEDLDFTPTDRVGPGAVIGFGGLRYVVGVVSDEFEVDGTTYEGISADSPIYAQMSGLRVGDEFTFNGQAHRIEFIA